MPASESRAVLQLVPRLSGQLDGVADYARALGAALQSGGGTRVSYLSGDPTDDLVVAHDTEPVSRVGSRSNTALNSALGQFSSAKGARAILVHYVNYGYASRGCPFWLVRGLSEWKRRFPGIRMVTMFHELYASGPPWRSSFWLSPMQRILARLMYSLSDAVVTNREASRRWLEKGGSAARRIRVMPVFSCLGEPAKIVDWHERRAQLVVAGSSGACDRAYGASRSQLELACTTLGIQEVVDIGARTGPIPARIGNAKVSALGHLSPVEASSVLSQARAGFIDYPSGFLGKSTVFAAYAAHGVVPVVSKLHGTDEPGLAESAGYWVPDSGEVPADFAAIACKARNWYSGHRLSIQSFEFRDALFGEPVAP